MRGVQLSELVRMIERGLEATRRDGVVEALAELIEAGRAMRKNFTRDENWQDPHVCEKWDSALAKLEGAVK